MNDYIRKQYNELLRRMGTKMVPTQWGYDETEWNAVAAYYFTGTKKDEKQAPPSLSNFIKNFSKFEYLFTSDHEAAAEYLADYIYAFHQSAAAASKQDAAEAKKGLQAFANDLLKQLPLSERSKEAFKGAFFVRLNVNYKIEQSFNLRVATSETEKEQIKKIIWPEAKTEDDYNKAISEFFYPVMQTLFNPTATDIEVVEEIEKLLKVVKIRYKKTGEVKEELDTPILVYLTNMVILAEPGPINSHKVKDRFYRALHEVMNMPEHRKGVALYKEQCKDFSEWFSYIARTKPVRDTNYYHVLEPKAAQEEESEKKFNKSKWKGILLMLSFCGVIIGSFLGAFPMALTMGLAPLYLGVVGTGIRSEGGAFHHINKVFSLEWIKANQTPLVCGLAAVAAVAIVFASVATSGALPLAAVIFTLPLVGKTTMGSMLLSFILPTVFSITMGISKKIFGDRGEKDYKDHVEMKQLNENIKKQRSELVLIDKKEPVIESKNAANQSNNDLVDHGIEMDDLSSTTSTSSSLTA